MVRLVLCGLVLLCMAGASRAADAPPFPVAKPVIIVRSEPPKRPTVQAEQPAPAMEVAAWIQAAGAGSLLIAVVLLGLQTLSARSASRRGLRAYLAARMPAAPRLDTDWTDAAVVVTNHGRTPALDVDYAATWIVLDHPNASVERVMTGAAKLFGTRKLVLAPGAELPLHLRTVLTDDEKREIEDGTHRRLYALGEVRYRDAFGAHRTLRFCFQYGGAELIGRGEMQLADTGNCGD